MHVGIVLAVEADDAEEAIALVEGFNEYNAQWSDWSEHGGRWSSVIPNSVLRYSDNPELFDAVVDDFCISTFRGVEEMLDNIGSVNIRDLTTDPKYDSIWEKKESSQSKEDREIYINNSLARYRGLKVLSVVNNRFTQDTYFYDIENYSIHRDSLDERIEKEPTRQYIVVWDYHF